MRHLEIEAVPHGFRSRIHDWTMEQTAMLWAVDEAALAQNLSISVELARARTDLFEKSQQLLE